MLKRLHITKSLVNDLVLTYNKIVNIPETGSINFNDKTNYWLLFAVLLAIVSLIL